MAETHGTHNRHDQAREGGTQVTDLVQKTWHGVEETAADYYTQGRKMAGQWEQKLEGYIRNKPLPSLLLAAGVSLLLGMFWKRR